MKNKSQIINNFLEKGFLISPDFFENVPEGLNNQFFKNIEKNIKTADKPLIINADLFKAVASEIELNINWVDFEKSKTSLEKGRDKKIYTTFLDVLHYNLSEEKKHEVEHILEDIKKTENKIILEKENGNSENPVLILKNYKEINKKREVQDFTYYFRIRYEELKKILLNRIELQNSISINRLKSNSGRQAVSLIGIVLSKIKTKNGNILINLEDPTGTTKILINKNRKELINLAEDIVLDEVIGIKGILNENFVFVDNVFLPDITEIKQKKADDEVYAVFTSDIHMGLKNFLIDDFNNFIKWLNSDYGNKEQKDLAKKVKYLFIVGDLVEGVGVYPDQEKDLVINDVYKQYEILADFLKKIPKHIKIIACAGNHDALRIAEPQPVLDKKIAKPIYDMENVTMVTNPSLVNIHASKDFDGFNILLYHGFSMPYYAEEVSSIRVAGGQSRADLIMKFFLERRHFAPTHTSNRYIPDPEQDPLVIDKVPDFLITGHIHRASSINYKGVTCLNCSCWASQTEEEARRGLDPEPSKVILVNLKTREIKILNFSK